MVAPLLKTNSFLSDTADGDSDQSSSEFGGVSDEQIQEEIDRLSFRCRRVQRDIEYKKSALQKIIDTKKKREDCRNRFLESFHRLFSERNPNLGNYDGEEEIFLRKKDELEKEIFEHETDLVSLEKTLADKREEFEKLQRSREEKKAPERVQENLVVENGIGEKVSDIEVKDSFVGGAVSKPLMIGEAKAIWDRFSNEEKKAVLSTRDHIWKYMEEASEGEDRWFLFADLMKEKIFLNVLDESQLKKVRAARDKKGMTLILSILSQRIGKLSFLEEEVKNVSMNKQ